MAGRPMPSHARSSPHPSALFRPFATVRARPARSVPSKPTPAGGGFHGTERAETRSDGRIQGRNGAGWCGEDRASAVSSAGARWWPLRSRPGAPQHAQAWPLSTSSGGGRRVRTARPGPGPSRHRGATQRRPHRVTSRPSPPSGPATSSPSPRPPSQIAQLTRQRRRRRHAVRLTL